MHEIKRLKYNDIIKYRVTIIEYLYASNCNSLYMDSYTIKDAKDKYEQLLEYIEQQTAYVVAALQDDLLCGFIWAYHFPFRDDHKRFYVSILHIGEEYRNKNIGKQLLDETEKIAHEQGYTAMFLHAEACNDGAIRFYQREGFTLERIQFVKKICNTEEIYQGGIT